MNAPHSRCVRHGRPAGWTCTVCDQALCPDCAAFKTVTPATFLACGLCGELAVPLLRLKSDSASLAKRLLQAFAFPFRGSGLAAWLGLSLWLWVTGLFGVIIMLLAWGEESDLYEPVLGDAQPTGALPEKKPSSPQHASPAEIVMAEPEVSIHPETSVARASLDSGALPSFAEQSAQSIRAAMQAGKTETALDGFRSTGLAVAERLSFDELVWLGQTAASHIDSESAELAFRTAAGRTGPAESLGRVRVMLARLLAERLNRRADATMWMQRVVAEQPGTAAAQYATSWLSAPLPTSPHVGP